MRFPRIAGALALCALSLGVEAAETHSPARLADATWQTRLADAIRAATAASPELARMDAEVRAAEERARQADALPDPEVSVGAMNVPVDTFS
ncbi:MAG TPA: hypothetical protein VFL12_11090, partial [Thermoanaerobaculia bacterium]|nr:hypothetical protein [Thermoanaerobaculia bacterium]